MASCVSPKTIHFRHQQCIATIGIGRRKIACIATFLLLAVSIPSCYPQEVPAMPFGFRSNFSDICRSIDIRNSIEAFDRLRGCRVVEGFVQILLLDRVDETLLNNISFPYLTEITDYLLLYRVNGLRSLSQLFPNLAIIHGQVLFFGHSLVIFEMLSLEEIGLYSLTDIVEGTIRIDKNPSLCFLKSLDWDRITRRKDKHFIQNMKSANECPVCPSDDRILPSDLRTISCPVGPLRLNGERYKDKDAMCWDTQHCQRICPEGCLACNSKGVCCDDSCLGGCADNDVTLCTACKDLELGSGRTRGCVKSCPVGLYEYLGKRCIREEECRRLQKPLNQKSVSRDFPYLLFNSSCLLQCPMYYTPDYENRTCKLCEDGRCVKECQGVNVDSVSVARQLRGCTHIKGSLEIQIRTGTNIVTALEENLKMIEEIDGYLKVVRCFPLISLSFFKHLKVIRGNILESDKYAFVVLDNQNLMELWEMPPNRTFEIDKGRFFFHFNPKLCLNKIQDLQNRTNIPPFTELEVAPLSNGDKTACNITPLDVRVSTIGSRGAILKWNQFTSLEDQRKLLSYTVYTREAKYQNVTMFDGRDACGNEEWHVIDIGIPKDPNASVISSLQHLKPYTQYAYYVKTYTIAKEQYGAQSSIGYFKTKPDFPSEPVFLTASSEPNQVLKIKWGKPSYPNGIIHSYIIRGKKTDLDEEESVPENYCSKEEFQQISTTTTASPPPIMSNDTCLCREFKKPKIEHKNEMVEVQRINFEDALQNEVYVKNTRTRRSVDDRTFPSTSVQEDDKLPKYSNDTTEDGRLINFERTVYNKTEIAIDKLVHYSNYEILVQACRKKEDKEDVNLCSNKSYYAKFLTTPMDGADDIPDLKLFNKSLEFAAIQWEEPKNPNGLIHSYFIEYKRNDGLKIKPTTDCITRDEYVKQERIYTLYKLGSGNYSLRVRARTSNGLGKFSRYLIFYIEEPSSTITMVIVISVPVILLGVLAFIILYRRQKLERDIMRLVPSINPDYSFYEPDEWEISRKNIEILNELGQGSFGMVYEGVMTTKSKERIKCAIKTVNDNATQRERLEFLNEAAVMKAFTTPHVVQLLGVVSQGQPTLVIMELMAYGDLKSFLRSHRPDAETFDPTKRTPPTLKQILQMAVEIADGMAYLAAKKFVHRDLAARNCMVSDDLTVKIGDFGMTRDIYETDYYRKGTKGLLPIRWMSPESLKDGVFTTSSDVWSYGVVLWEMSTLASQPYQGLSNDQVLRYVIDGGVMERPENCPDRLYNLMRSCWVNKPSRRPTFFKLCSLLVEDSSREFIKESFYYKTIGLELKKSTPTPPPQDEAAIPLRAEGDTEHSSSYVENLRVNTKPDSDPPQVNLSSITVEGKDGLKAAANGFVSGGPTAETAN